MNQDFPLSKHPLYEIAMSDVMIPSPTQMRLKSGVEASASLAA